MKVIVVGAGLAGTVAAARAHGLGAQVVVVADRPGATALHGGGWAIGPAALVAQGLLPQRLDEALGFVRAGLPALALTRGPFALYDTDGVRRAVDMAPASHAAARKRRGRWLVADLAPLGHPFAEMLGAVGAPVAVDWPRWPGAFGRSFAAAAARFDGVGEADALLAALAAGLAPHGEIEGVLLPPVLGLDQPEVHRAVFEEALGIRVAEALGTTPGTPGLRLHRALEAWLARLEIPVRRGRVTALHAEACQVEIEGRLEGADAVVLAVGGRLSGGLDGSEVTPLCLPVRPRPPLDKVAAVRSRGPYWGRLFEGGLRVDDRMRVLGLDGGVIDPHVLAAGDVLAGPDPVATRCASGKAVLSGYLAGENAAKGGPR